MMMIKIVLFAIFCIFVQVLCSKQVGTPQYEIRVGNCTKLTVKDLVFQKSVNVSQTSSSQVNVSIASHILVVLLLLLLMHKIN